MTHRCHYQACLDNHGGWCYAGGCKLNPAPEPEPERDTNTDTETENTKED